MINQEIIVKVTFHQERVLYLQQKEKEKLN
jgi:hypothetical protein